MHDTCGTVRRYDFDNSEPTATNTKPLEHADATLADGSQGTVPRFLVQTNPSEPDQSRLWNLAIED